LGQLIDPATNAPSTIRVIALIGIRSGKTGINAVNAASSRRQRKLFDQ
jgi:hypothetical protein